MTHFNADDYGITPEQAEHILDCRRQGRLTGVSAMPNSPHLEKAMALLETEPGLRVAVHLNVTEGLSLSEPETVPLLTDGTGRFRQSFLGLLILSLGPKRAALRTQLTEEFARQIRRVHALTGDRPLRLDGHQHIQMIPLVLASAADAARAEGVQIGSLRWSWEPLWPYVRHASLWRYCRPVNLVKVLVLRALAVLSRRLVRGLDVPKEMVMGVALSGDMEYEPVRRLLPEMERIAARRGAVLELVMHPGWGVGPGQGLDRPGGPFEAFYLSPGRKKEYDCLRRL